MAVGQIISRAIATGAIGADQIATGAITAADIPAGEITADKLHTTLDLSSKTVTMPQASITAHQAALSITESQISDLQSYVLPNTSPTFTNTTLTGYLAGPATFTIDPAGVGDNTGTVVIAGNLQVDGTTTTINSTTLTVDDLNITLADGAADAAAANGAGITVAGANATITYDASNDEWDFNKDVNVTGNVYSSGYLGVGTTTAYSASTDFEVKATDPKMVFNNTGIRAFGLRVTGTNFQIRDESDNETWLTITHTGIIGIGTTAPSTTASGYEGGTLHIHNAGTGSSIRLTNSTTGTGTSAGMLISKWSDSKTYFTNFDNGADMLFTPTDSSGNLVANTFVIKGDGKIGFGTDSPSSNGGGTAKVLHVHSPNANAWAVTKYTNTTSGTGNGDGTVVGHIGSDAYLFNYESGGVHLGTSGGTKMFIKSDGNVGIGETNPQYQLHLAKSGSNYIQIDNDTNSVTSFLGVATDHLWLGTSTNHQLKFYANSDIKMVIDTNGKVGIGTSSPTQKLEVVGTTKAEQYLLDAIAKDISDTASDVFIYDTRKDSDGGAWRKRTQHTSWYNETLNTSKRGSRKEFPAVAVLAFNTNQELWIYDGDDPNLSLWAKYTTFTQDSGDTAAITAVNGSIYAGQANAVDAYSGNGYFQLNFAADYFFSNIVGTFGSYLQGRADGLLTSYDFRTRGDRTTSKYTVPNLKVNDIAVTVLPNAPIDSDTGLPTPTIALAMNGGVSVIKDDGTVVDYTGTSQGSDAPVDKISFIGTKRILFSHRYASEVVDLVSSDNSAAYYNQLSSFTGRITNSISHDDDIHVSALSSDNNIESIALNEEDAASKSVSGLSLANHYQVTSDPDRVSCFITTDYNTGWMNGDIKLATLSDTDTTNATDANIVTVASFTAGTGGAVSTSGSQLTITQTSGSNGRAVSPTFSTELGKKYMFTVEGVSSSGGAGFRAEVRGPEIVNNLFTGTSRITFDGTGGGIYVELYCMSGVGGSVTYDNILVQEIESDRSVNGGAGVGANGLQVFGTVTKSAVATGADLVGYSGFSGSNYLRQPYNSDLDFGTGDFSIIAWIKQSAYTNNYTCIIDKAEYGTGNNRIEFMFNSSTLRLDVNPNSITSSSGIGVANKWICVAAVRRNGVVSLYADGNLVGSGTASGNVSNSSHKLWVGVNYLAGNAGQDKQLALLRISATAPSPEQIKKIYEDEKVLFQDNAQATLYGSSNAVTALAYDDSTDLLHVGTSAGRSVFQGLRRVDNTTTAVGAAISASNGLVADE